MRVAMELAGWDHDEADALRKLLGKPGCSRKLPDFEARFRQGLEEGSAYEANHSLVFRRDDR